MTRSFAITIAALFVASAGFTVWARHAAIPLPSDTYLDVPAKPLPVPANAEVAIFAGGCFWGTEEAFRTIPGVIATQTGYAGGTTPNPTYHSIHSTDNTGYVEAVKIVYDPAKVGYQKLAEQFFATHDPTLPHRGSKRSIGRAYRSFVFTQNTVQANTAHSVIASLNKSARFAYPIATQVRPYTSFYPAEERHQLYYAKRNEAAKCLL